MYRYLAIAIIAGIVGSSIAQRKGHNRFLWFILCAVVPLLIIVILVLPTKVAMGLTKKCIFCSEIIKSDARLCKYCGYANQGE